MILVGVTGLIGSGKSYMCDIFEHKDIPVFYCDDEAKALYETAPYLKAEVIDMFDCETGGKVDTKKLGKIVFADKNKLQYLEKIVNHYFIERFNSWVYTKKQEGHKFVLVENAIMFKNNFYQRFDFIIGVTLEEERRIQQTIDRDKCTREDVINRLNKNLSATELYPKCDLIFYSGYDDERLNCYINDLIYYFNNL